MNESARNSLGRFLVQGKGGYWDLLATAAGNRHAVESTRRALSMEAFRQGVAGDAGTPSLVQARVDALAAHSASVLGEVAGGWTKPTSWQVNLFDDEMDLLLAAWIQAARFLAKSGVLSADELTSGIPALRDEQAARFGTGVLPRSWIDLVDVLAADELDHVSMCQAERAQWPYGSIGADMLRQLLETGTERADLKRLRVLRGHTASLTTEAWSLLEEYLEEPMRRLDAADRGLVIALETLASGRPERLEDLARNVEAYLRNGGDPEVVLRPAYIAITSDWISE